MLAPGAYAARARGVDGAAVDAVRLRHAQKYEELLELIAHEYFHLWNVKRIRPRALGRRLHSEELHPLVVGRRGRPATTIAHPAAREAAAVNVLEKPPTSGGRCWGSPGAEAQRRGVVVRRVDQALPPRREQRELDDLVYLRARRVSGDGPRDPQALGGQALARRRVRRLWGSTGARRGTRTRRAARVRAAVELDLDATFARCVRGREDRIWRRRGVGGLTCAEEGQKDDSDGSARRVAGGADEGVGRQLVVSAVLAGSPAEAAGYTRGTDRGRGGVAGGREGPGERLAARRPEVRWGDGVPQGRGAAVEVALGRSRRRGDRAGGRAGSRRRRCMGVDGEEWVAKW